jgi:hypothetical protein
MNAQPTRTVTCATLAKRWSKIRTINKLKEIDRDGCIVATSSARSRTITVLSLDCKVCRQSLGFQSHVVCHRVVDCVGRGCSFAFTISSFVWASSVTRDWVIRFRVGPFGWDCFVAHFFLATSTAVNHHHHDEDDGTVKKTTTEDAERERTVQLLASDSSIELLLGQASSSCRVWL